MAHPSPSPGPSSAPPGPALRTDGLRDIRPYRDPDIDYQQLVNARHAPRWLRGIKRYGWLPQD